MTLRDARLHVVLGMEPDEWDRVMEEIRQNPDADGLDCSLNPRWHSHPLLGITGHSHSTAEQARRPHGHKPIATWDHTPIFVDDGLGEKP